MAVGESLRDLAPLGADLFDKGYDLHVFLFTPFRFDVDRRVDFVQPALAALFGDFPWDGLCDNSPVF